MAQGKTDIRDDAATSTVVVEIETRRGDDGVIPQDRPVWIPDHPGPGTDEASQSLLAGEDVPAPMREGTPAEEGPASVLMVSTQVMVTDEEEEIVADVRTETEAEEAEEVEEEVATRTNSGKKSKNCSISIAMCTR